MFSELYYSIELLCLQAMGINILAMTVLLYNNWYVEMKLIWLFWTYQMRSIMFKKKSEETYAWLIRKY